jgi:hypothetical protein
VIEAEDARADRQTALDERPGGGQLAAGSKVATQAI